VSTGPPSPYMRLIHAAARLASYTKPGESLPEKPVPSVAFPEYLVSQVSPPTAGELATVATDFGRRAIGPLMPHIRDMSRPPRDHHWFSHRKLLVA
jgi:hypothetical protein